VASLEAFVHAAAEFVVADLDLVTEPAALAAAQRSLQESGLLLLGEVHGVRENPLLVRALMQAFGLTSVALEWPDDLASVIGAFLATGTLADHALLWPGDGRITAGHLAVLAERAVAGPLEVILRQRQIRLYQHHGALVLDLPSAEEAVVPQRSQRWPPPARTGP
jgi:hypothetical protein